MMVLRCGVNTTAAILLHHHSILIEFRKIRTSVREVEKVQRTRVENIHHTE